jgi:hypothetical protein
MIPGGNPGKPALWLPLQEAAAALYLLSKPQEAKWEAKKRNEFFSSL